MTKINSKQCTKCEETKPLTDFHKAAANKDGLQYRCKECQITAINEHAAKNRDTFEFKTSVVSRQARYQAKKYGVENTLTLAETRAILSCERCAYCGEHTPENKRTQDHVIPMKEGGGNTFENVVMACATCNSAKHDKPVYDFIMKKAHKDATRLLLGTLAERMDVAPIQVLRRLERQQTAYSRKQFYAKHYGESAQ